MAMLLAFYQKMRLVREKNQVTYDQVKYTGKYDRVTKAIEKVQKRYTSLFEQLKQEASRMEKRAAIDAQARVGLGNGVVNPNSLSVNGVIFNTVKGMMMDLNLKNDPEENEKFVDAMMGDYFSHGKFTRNNNAYSIPGMTDDIANKFVSAVNVAQLDLSERQQASQKLTACMQDNVSIWLDIEKAKLEEQQDAELAPLQYQETMWELEKEQAELKLKRINAQLETYDQLLSQETEKSAPKFGLG